MNLSIKKFVVKTRQDRLNVLGGGSKKRFSLKLIKNKKIVSCFQIITETKGKWVRW